MLAIRQFVTGKRNSLLAVACGQGEKGRELSLDLAQPLDCACSITVGSDREHNLPPRQAEKLAL